MTEDARSSRRKRFVKAVDRPAEDMVARQMQAAVRAFKALGSIEAARAFLNQRNEALNGRPIDVAGLSSEGLDSVILVLGSGCPV